MTDKGTYGLNNASTGAGQVNSSKTAQLNVAFLVAKIDWTNGADTISLFVNPTVGGALGAPDAVKTDLDIVDLSNLGISTGVNGVWNLDEIRIGDTFLAVAPRAGGTNPIPLPGALLAFPATAAFAAAAMRKFRRA